MFHNREETILRLKKVKLESAINFKKVSNWSAENRKKVNNRNKLKLEPAARSCAKGQQIPSSKLKLLSIVVYLATAWRSWTQGIFLVTVTSDTEKCIANLMYYFT